jgi:hypothetical protein
MLAEVNASIAAWQHAGHAGLPPVLVDARPATRAMLAAGELLPIERMPCAGASALPVGDGWITSIVIPGDTENRGMFLRRGQNGVRLHQRIPDDVETRTRLHRASAVVWEDLDRGRVTIELELVIESADRNAMLTSSLLDSADCRDPRVDGTILAAHVEGGGRWTTMGEVLVVETRGPGVPTAVRLEVQTSMMNRGLLGAWLPVPVLDGINEVDIVIAHRPVSLTTRTDTDGPYVPLLLPGGEPVAAPPGWTAVRYRGRHRSPVLAFVRTINGPPITINVGETMVTLGGDFVDCPDAVTAAIRRLPGPAPAAIALGNTPPRHRPDGRVDLDDLWNGWYGGGVIAVCADGGYHFCIGKPRAVLTVLHELAHAWWAPGTVPSPSLNEALTEYRTLLLATPDEQWQASSAGVTGEGDLEVSVTAEVGYNSDEARWMRYTKGPLVLRAVERDVGAATMVAAIDDYFTRRRGLPSSWRDLADSIERVGGAAAGEAARKRFADPGWPGAW